MKHLIIGVVIVQFATSKLILAGDPFERDVRPFLHTHCVRCYNAEKEEGGVRLDSIGSIDTEGRFGNTWPEVQRRVINEDKPPEDA